MAKHNLKKEYVCLDCGHMWKGERSSTIVCPHCGRELTVDTSRTWNFSVKDYFAVITKCNGFQVVRMFLMATHLRRGEPAHYWIGEAFQRWITPTGENIIISRRRPFMARYCDSFDFSSELSLKMEIAGHTVAPYKVIGQARVIPEIKRNGFTGDFHDINPYRLFNALLKNNRVETLWKVGQFELAKHFIRDSYYRFDEYWPSIKIAMRHHYMVRDASMWIDYLRCLKELGKDIRNPKIIFPQDLSQAHDECRHRLDIEYQRRAERRERERRLYESEEYFKTELYRKDECRYQEMKSRFFDLSFGDGEITVKPLVSIKEFAEEGKLMSHCVFAMKYFQKENSLIFHALVDGTSVATIELNLKTMEVVQCRGPHNSKPELYDRITALIKGHTSEIIAKKTIQNKNNHDRGHADCA